MKPAEIKLKRVNLLMTQQEFADKLNVSRQTVNYWERGIFKPTEEHIKLIKSMTKQVFIKISSDFVDKEEENYYYLSKPSYHS